VTSPTDHICSPHSSARLSFRASLRAPLLTCLTAGTYAVQARELLELQRAVRILREKNEALADDVLQLRAEVSALEKAHQQDLAMARAAQQAATTAATSSSAAAAAAAADAADKLALLSAELGAMQRLHAESKVRSNTESTGAHPAINH
jgi:hypothetical protein